MQGSFSLQKMNPQVSAYEGKRGGWCDDGKMRAGWRHSDNVKPRSKSNYSNVRRLKEKSYVWNE